MVPGKGKYANISKGKGTANIKGASTSKSKEIKRERDSTESEDEEQATLPNIRLIDYTKTLPRFTASKLFKLINIYIQSINFC